MSPPRPAPCSTRRRPRHDQGQTLPFRQEGRRRDGRCLGQGRDRAGRGRGGLGGDAAGDAETDPVGRRQERRRAGGGAARRHHGGQKNTRSHPALSPVEPQFGIDCTGLRYEKTRRRHRSDRENQRKNRGRDGGADRGFGRRADHLRYVQGGGSRHAHREYPPPPQIRRQVGDLRGAMISVDEARERLLAALQPLGTEQIPVSDGFGRILAEDLAARRTQPPSALSAMDGYAVRAADVANIPARLTVTGAVPAGKSFDKTLGAGEAVRIFTGAPLPAGADAIVIQEDTDRDGDVVVVKESSPVGRHVREAGLDFREGDVRLKAGRRLTARDVGLAAAMNHPWLRVYRRPRVAILPTGDEIVLPGDPIGPNQIVSSNSFALGALVQACGGVPIALPIAPDDPRALQQVAATATGIDLLVTTGGASVGEHDLIRDALGETGLVLDFWQIAMRPGKPLMVGTFRGTPMIGLPG